MEITGSPWNDIWDEIAKKYAFYKEQEAFSKAKEDKLIEEAVLIMHPKHKDVIVNSELSKATIIWSYAVEEDKAYMVVDEDIKANIRNSLRY